MRGWDTQLPDEPVINLGYTVAHLAAAGHPGGLAEWRIVPVVGTVGLGTYFTDTLFKNSRSVDTEPFVGMASYGFSVRHGRFTLGFAYNFFTKTFETERENVEFGAMSLSCYY